MILALLLACRAEDLPVHHLVMGGDVMLGRRLNVALADPGASARIFAALTPALAGADLTLVNAEGVISEGGTYADKGEPRPHQHHAGPGAVEVLRAAGVDVVTMGNNHAGDYGPAALVEARDRLRLAGIGVAGAGVDAAEARAPVYRRVGDVVVAIVGVELTMAGRHAAGPDRAGIFHLDGMVPARADAVVAELLAIEREARTHAHVVLLSPHWGDNFVTEPTALTRRLGHALVDGGYDAILGHSAHVLQGVEVYRGAPIVYDAGDLVMDYGGDDEAHRAVLYDLSFTRAGVTGLRATPIFLESNRTAPASGARATSILADWRTRSEALGTHVEEAGGIGVVACAPGGIRGPGPGDTQEAPPLPGRPVPASPRVAPSETFVDTLPPTAVPAAVHWPSLGLTLLGTELLADRLRPPKAGNVVRLYFRADGPLPEDLLVRIGTDDDSPDAIDDHLPGDWMLPGPRWPAGRIVQDRFLVRLLGTPEGTVTFRAGVVVDGRVVPPASTDRPIEGGLVEVGRATYEAGAPGLFELLTKDPRGGR